jgi:hypothetical protein
MELDKIEVIIDDVDEKNVDKLIYKCLEIRAIKKQLEELEEHYKTKIKMFLKAKRWDRYYIKPDKINVTLSQHKKETFEEDKLKMYLSDSQLAQVKTINTFEKLLIITEQNRKQLKYYLKNKNKIKG